MSGLDLMEELRANGVEAPVIFMTGHGDVALAVEAMRRGALTFLEKPLAPAAIETAIRQAFEDAAAPPKPAARRSNSDGAQSARPAAPSPEYQSRIDRLTAREREVMDLLVAGAVLALWRTASWIWIAVAAVDVVVQLVMAPVLAGWAVLAYLDLRVRTEGLDLELEAMDRFDAPTATPGVPG